MFPQIAFAACPVVLAAAVSADQAEDWAAAVAISAVSAVLAAQEAVALPVAVVAALAARIPKQPVAAWAAKQRLPTNPKTLLPKKSREVYRRSLKLLCLNPISGGAMPIPRHW